MKGTVRQDPGAWGLSEQRDRAGREGLQLDARELLWHCPSDMCPLARSLPEVLSTDCSWVSTFHLP